MLRTRRGFRSLRQTLIRSIKPLRTGRVLIMETMSLTKGWLRLIPLSWIESFWIRRRLNWSGRSIQWRIRSRRKRKLFRPISRGIWSWWLRVRNSSQIWRFRNKKGPKIFSRLNSLRRISNRLNRIRLRWRKRQPSWKRKSKSLRFRKANWLSNVSSSKRILNLSWIIKRSLGRGLLRVRGFPMIWRKKSNWLKKTLKNWLSRSILEK